MSLLILVLFFRASLSGGLIRRTIRDRGLEQRCPNSLSSRRMIMGRSQAWFRHVQEGDLGSAP